MNGVLGMKAFRSKRSAGEAFSAYQFLEFYFNSNVFWYISAEFLPKNFRDLFIVTCLILKTLKSNILATI